jgi:general secretion pathway protein A
MYDKFYNFTAKPFALNPNPAFLYASSQHAAALTMLDYFMESQAPFCMLTGEVGSGKTTLLRHFLRVIDDETTVGLISNTHLQFRSIHPWALSALGIAAKNDSEIAQYEALVDFFIQQYSMGRRTLLVVDEAHNLSPTILEELRLLSNVNSESDLSLQVLLVGQPELRDSLRRPELEQFAQRVSVDFHIGSLTLQDTRAYIRHRLVVAGGSPTIFDEEGTAFVHARTRGIPRLINQLCDWALVYAFAEQRKNVDLSVLQSVLEDRKQRGAIPLFGGAASAPRVSVADLSREHG